MAKTVQSTNATLPSLDDQKAFRHFGDGTAGELVAARLQGYDSSTLDYIDVAVDTNGRLVLGSSVTVHVGMADQGTGAGAAAPWSMELSDGAAFYTAAKTGQFPAALVGNRLDVNLGASAATVTVTGPLTDTQLRASAVPVDVSDRSARLLGHVTVDNATLAVTQSTSPWVTSRNWTLSSGTDSAAVTGTFWQTTQPISVASLPLPTNAAIELGGMLQQHTEILQQILVETRIQSMQLSQGLNVPDDPAALRSDPAYTS